MKVPLTVQHTKEDWVFFTMPEAQLIHLLDVEFDKILEEIIKVKKDWIENKRCECAEHNDIQTGRLVLSCEHIKKILDENKIIQEADKKTDKMTSALVYRGLYAFLKQNEEGKE